MKVGETRNVYLQGNPSTGFTWANSISPILNIRSMFTPSTGIGAGGIYTFAITAICQGKTTINFRYERSFEGTPIESRILTVYVD